MQFDYWRHRLRARLFEWLRRPDAALEEYRRLLAIAPRDPRVLNVLGYHHAQARNWSDALDAFEAALELDAANADAWFNTGYVREQLADRVGAIAAFRKAIELAPAHDRAWYGLGMAYAGEGRHAEAVEALAEAARLQPMNAVAWYALGMAHHAARNAEPFTEVVRHLHRFDPVMTRRLIQDSGRSDLAHLVSDLRV